MGASSRVPIADRGRIAARASIVVVVLVAGLAGCGASSKSKPAATHSTAPNQSASPSSGAGQSSLSNAAMRVTLHGPNHAPIVGKNWVYSVRATDASGRPLSGTVETEFTFAGQVVGHETPPTHPLKHGTLSDTLNWPKAAVGQPLNLQTVVHTSKGSATLDWPVTVRP